MEIRMQGPPRAPVLAALCAFRQSEGEWSARARAMVGVAVVAVACALSLPSAQRPSANGGTPTAPIRAAAWERLPIGARALISRTVAGGSPAFAAHSTPAGYRLAGGGVSAADMTPAILARRRIPVTTLARGAAQAGTSDVLLDIGENPSLGLSSGRSRRGPVGTPWNGKP